MKELYLAVFSLSLVFYCVKTLPVDLRTLDFDNLDADLDSLSYEVEEEDLDDFDKLLDDQEAHHTDDINEQTKSKAENTSGYTKKNTSIRDKKNKHNIQNLMKFYKAADAHDKGAYDDHDIYGAVKGATAQAVGIKGKEDRTYRKGTKTRGFYRVHHKDEYKKAKVIYEDDETSGTIKKVGVKDLGYKTSAGASFDRGHFRNDRSKDAYGKHGYSDKGFSENNVHESSDKQEFDGYFSR